MKNLAFLYLVLLIPAFCQAQDPDLQAKIKYNEGLALVSNGQNDCAQALQLFTEALALDNSNPKIHYMKGYCENRLNQVETAIQSFKLAKEKAFIREDTPLFEQANRSIYHAYVRLAAFAVQNKDASAVIRALDDAAQYSTETPSTLIHYYYAFAFNLQERYTSALTHAQKATEGLGFAAGERYAPFFFELGTALEFTGQMEQAVRAYEKASYGIYRNQAEERIAKIRELYIIY